MSKKIRVFDFFSGCGGTSQGLKTAGCEIVFGLDFDYDSSETFKANNPDAVFINDDIRSVDVADISQLVETQKKMQRFCSAGALHANLFQSKIRIKPLQIPEEVCYQNSVALSNSTNPIMY